MKTTTHDNTEEKRILTGMIVDTVVLGRVAEKWKKEEGLFRVRWANLIGGWCVRYFSKYAKAPGKNIRGLFESWAERATDKNTVDLVESFLGHLSEDFAEEKEAINADYLVDIAGTHFNAVALERMTEMIAGHIDKGDVPKAIAAAATWNKVEMGIGAGIDVFRDQLAIREAFESKAEPLIKYPGALGQFFGDQFGRDEFVAITGATGRGKTWWLIDLAWTAVKQSLRTALFQVGDMSQAQVLRRIMCRATGHPLKPNDATQNFIFQVPISIAPSEGGDEDSIATVEYEEKKFNGPLQWENAWKVVQDKTRRHKTPLFRLSVHPNSSINVDGILGILSTWERAGWVPDVIVIDYADLLMAPAGFTPGDREAINETWKQLRGLSQRMHNLVITATQADANSYTANIISRSNFSDDRRKNDHVTGMLGINQTDPEKLAGIYRLNWTKRREEAYTEKRCVYVAGNLGLGRPHIKSCF